MISTEQTSVTDLFKNPLNYDADESSLYDSYEITSAEVDSSQASGQDQDECILTLGPAPAIPHFPEFVQTQSYAVPKHQVFVAPNEQPIGITPMSVTMQDPRQQKASALRSRLNSLLGRKDNQAEVQPPPYSDPTSATWQDPELADPDDEVEHLGDFSSPHTPHISNHYQPEVIYRDHYQPSYFQVKQEFNSQPNVWEQQSWGYPPLRGIRKRKQKPKKSQKVDPTLPMKRSKYRHVYWERRDQKWRARIYLGRKRYSGGSYVNERECALAVNRLCRQFGLPPSNPELEGLSLGEEKVSDISFIKSSGPRRPSRRMGGIHVKSEHGDYYGEHQYGHIKEEPRDVLDF